MKDSNLLSTERQPADATRAAARQTTGQMPVRLPLEAMDPQLTSIQPGGGMVMKLELAWGRVRRWYLKRFRPTYVRRMAESRIGDVNRCPHEVLDPRDVKFHQNQGGFKWAASDDPFAWRENLPFARQGLAELVLGLFLTFGFAAFLVMLAALLRLSGAGLWLAGLMAGVCALVGGLIAWFFRDPNRQTPQDPGSVLAPADGTIVNVDEVEHEEFIGGPAVVVGIFLSIVNVHVNRAPVAARVIGLKYRPGKCLNALRAESAKENEQLAVRLEQNQFPYRRIIVRQITGAIARRIVCRLRPGDELHAGERFGMIKLGSRTELVLPRDESLRIEAKVGQKVRAGSSVLARYDVGTT